jgi:hypothetical protein
MPGGNADNIFRLIYDKIDDQGTDIATMQDDLALIKADIAAIRAILES